MSNTPVRVLMFEEKSPDVPVVSKINISEIAQQNRFIIPLYSPGSPDVDVWYNIMYDNKGSVVSPAITAVLNVHEVVIYGSVVLYKSLRDTKTYRDSPCDITEDDAAALLDTMNGRFCKSCYQDETDNGLPPITRFRSWGDAAVYFRTGLCPRCTFADRKTETKTGAK